MSARSVRSQQLSEFCVACFEKVGLAPAEARLTADNLIFANLRGVDSHGVIRLKAYVERLRAGGFRANAQPRVLSEGESSALLDAEHGMGQVAATMAMRLAIEKAKKTGVAVVSVRNSNHFGASAF